MPLSERITSVDKLRSWTDQIPLHYEYTAGVAGERFLRGVKEGRIMASVCKKCGRRYLPPKMYCVNCFSRIDSYRSVRLPGTVAALTESYVRFDGTRLRAPVTLVFVTFPGVRGGLVQSGKGRGLGVGSKVSPRFKAQGKRTGSLADFEFVKVSA